MLYCVDKMHWIFHVESSPLNSSRVDDDDDVSNSRFCGFLNAV